MDAYIIRRTLEKGRPRYQLWRISVSGLCLPGSFSMENGAKQKLIVALVSFLLPYPFLLLPLFLMARKRTYITGTNHYYRAFTCGLYYVRSSPRDSCYLISC